MLTDSHCHLASAKFDAAEVPALIERARHAGVTRLISLATCLDDIQAHLDLATTYPEVHCCLGIHPCEAHDAPDDVIAQLRPHLTHPQVAAIGETGLDYFHPAPADWQETDYRRRQTELLEAHFALASECGLNLVIHTRDRQGDASFQDALSIYRGFSDQTRAVFHCFISSPENARAVIDLGGRVSFGGVATFKNATSVLDLAAKLPPGSFMLETDSPYLSPHPHRGQRNEPARTSIIAQRIAEARGETIEQLASHTTQTAIDFFKGIE
ncbi:TatD DNase family protein [Haloferula luteola]|uniref:TatD DNase family protein n=1 Tax=Haloferula luteola TaxID=595692 RepID=A0A840VD19_9BACT|nr:TatD family hydrolase [Haloferula luteola]MBB5350751.1 TatD DNase family protein [Haloferula luteola]